MRTVVLGLAIGLRPPSPAGAASGTTVVLRADGNYDDPITGACIVGDNWDSWGSSCFPGVDPAGDCDGPRRFDQSNVSPFRLNAPTIGFAEEFEDKPCARITRVKARLARRTTSAPDLECTGSVEWGLKFSGVTVDRITEPACISCGLSPWLERTRNFGLASRVDRRLWMGDIIPDPGPGRPALLVYFGEVQFDWESPDNLDCGIDATVSLSDSSIDVSADPDPIATALVVPHCCTRSVLSWVEVENTESGAITTLCTAQVDGPREFECPLPAAALGTGVYLVRVHHRGFVATSAPACCAELTEGSALASEPLVVVNCSPASGASVAPGGHGTVGDPRVLAPKNLDPANFTITMSDLEDNDATDDDLLDWLPKACPLGATPPPDCDSTGTGRLIKIIVAMDAAQCGANEVLLALEDVSTNPGIAMNYARPGRPPNEPDVVIDGPTAMPFDTPPLPADRTAVFTLVVRDYAARARVVASIPDAANPTEPPLVLSLDIPADADGNRIADAAWTSEDDDNNPAEQATVCEGAHCAPRTPALATCVDNEVVSPIANGDGFTNWEEYRGVICQQAHRRLNPLAADLFLGTVREPVAYANADWLRLVRTLPTREHDLREDEYGTINGSSRARQVQLDGIVCPDSGEPDDTLWPLVRYQLIAKVDLTPPANMPNAYGQSDVMIPCADGATPPRSALNCRDGDATSRINTLAHQATTPPNVLPRQGTPPPSLPYDTLDVPALQHTIAHEVGHVLGMTHYCLNCVASPTTWCGASLGTPINLCTPPDNCAVRAQCAPTTSPGCPASVMVNEFMWALPCCIVSPCAGTTWWTNLPAGYEQLDIDAVAIK